MPILSVSAQNASLDNDYGTTNGPNAVDIHYCALFVGDPALDGVELNDTDCPGYAAPAILAADWDPAEDGMKHAVAQFPDTEGEWSQIPTHFQLYDDATDRSNGWDNGVLSTGTPLVVTAAGTGPIVDISIFYSNAVAEPTP